jgi:hypothetical protein
LRRDDTPTAKPDASPDQSQLRQRRSPARRGTRSHPGRRPGRGNLGRSCRQARAGPGLAAARARRISRAAARPHRGGRDARTWRRRTRRVGSGGRRALARRIDRGGSADRSAAGPAAGGQGFAECTRARGGRFGVHARIRHRGAGKHPDRCRSDAAAGNRLPLAAPDIAFDLPKDWSDALRRQGDADASAPTANTLQSPATGSSFGLARTAVVNAMEAPTADLPARISTRRSAAA